MSDKDIIKELEEENRKLRAMCAVYKTAYDKTSIDISDTLERFKYLKELEDE